MIEQYFRSKNTNRLRPSLDYMNKHPNYKTQSLNTFGSSEPARILVEMLLKEIAEGGKDRFGKINASMAGFNVMAKEITNSNMSIKTKKHLIKHLYSVWAKPQLIEYFIKENISLERNTKTIGTFTLNVLSIYHKKYLNLIKEQEQKK